MNKTKKLLVSFIISLLVIPSFGLIARADDFDNGYIISDSDLTNYNSMTLEDIKNFLGRKAGTFDTFTAPDKDGNIKTAAQIIYEAAIEYKINPKFLLVMLQKEQSLVEDSTPRQSQFDWAMGYAVCDSCSVDDPDVILSKGFGIQVDKAAGVQRWYIDNTKNGWLKTPGKKYIIDGQDVYIQNQATANLYNYTPHIHGNYNFWKIWNSWFTQLYPDGTLLKIEGDSTIWLLSGGMRREFKSKSVLMSRYDINKVIAINKSELEKYPIGAPIKFANYSLFRTPDKEVYLLVDDKLRHFESAEVLRQLGFNPEEFEDVTEAEISFYQYGEPIGLTAVYPVGKLLQDKKTGGVYFVEDGWKYPLVSKDVLKINFPNQKIQAVVSSELEKYQTGTPILLRDGELVKSSDSVSVYFISNGKLRPILTGDVFEKLGYKWSNIKTVSPKTISIIPMGDVIDLDFRK